MVKTFVVGILSLFDYKLKLLKINAENEYEALKKGMIESCNEKYKQEEINWQNSEEYPKTYKELSSKGIQTIQIQKDSNTILYIGNNN